MPAAAWPTLQAIYILNVHRDGEGEPGVLTNKRINLATIVATTGGGMPMTSHMEKNLPKSQVLHVVNINKRNTKFYTMTRIRIAPAAAAAATVNKDGTAILLQTEPEKTQIT